MRIDGYAPIEEYALIGDGRTSALVARDGAIDWLCLPNFDSPSVCAAILDTRRGGMFGLQPSVPFQSSRRYIPNTNVLETTFTTDYGSVRIVDAMTLPDQRLEAMRELVRSVEGLSGVIPMRWRFTPRFKYGRGLPRCEWRYGVPVATWRGDAVAVLGWDTGTPKWRDHAVGAEFEIRAGAQAMLALVGTYAEPLVFPNRQALANRLGGTIRFWLEWMDARKYEGPWRDHVARSALVLKAL